MVSYMMPVVPICDGTASMYFAQLWPPRGGYTEQDCCRKRKVWLSERITRNFLFIARDSSQLYEPSLAAPCGACLASVSVVIPTVAEVFCRRLICSSRKREWLGTPLYSTVNTFSCHSAFVARVKSSLLSCNNPGRLFTATTTVSFFFLA